MRKRKSPTKLAEIIRDGLGPLHTATSSKKRKAHTAINDLKEQAEESNRKLQAIKHQLDLYDISDVDADVGLRAEETIGVIHGIVTKGGK